MTPHPQATRRRPDWRARYALALAAAAVWITPPPAQAQPVIDFGGQTPCAIWLSNPTARQQGLSWLFGAWSGLNMAAAMRNDVYDVGHTLRPAEVAAAVEVVCRQTMTKIMSLAVLEAYVAARAAHR